jgi:hypothetical protein
MAARRSLEQTNTAVDRAVVVVADMGAAVVVDRDVVDMVVVAAVVVAVVDMAAVAVVAIVVDRNGKEVGKMMDDTRSTSLAFL